ncbi:MAG: HupE/UreJ family protein, partial [Steroidobacteraceae bacterium]
MKALRWYLTALLLGLTLNSLPASAHKESDAFLTLRSDRADLHTLDGQWDIALRDLDFVLGIDSNHDGQITWGEVQAHRRAIEDYALARLALKGDGLT